MLRQRLKLRNLSPYRYLVNMINNPSWWEGLAKGNGLTLGGKKGVVEDMYRDAGSDLAVYADADAYLSFNPTVFRKALIN